MEPRVEIRIRTRRSDSGTQRSRCSHEPGEQRRSQHHCCQRHRNREHREGYDQGTLAGPTQVQQRSCRAGEHEAQQDQQRSCRRYLHGEERRAAPMRRSTERPDEMRRRGQEAARDSSCWPTEEVRTSIDRPGKDWRPRSSLEGMETRSVPSREVARGRDDPLLTVPEAGEYLGTGERFIRRLITERRIAYVKLGKYVRLQRSVLDAFVDAGRVPSQR
jgi:excisionase family DNA binding protein